MSWLGRALWIRLSTSLSVIPSLFRYVFYLAWSLDEIPEAWWFGDVLKYLSYQVIWGRVFIYKKVTNYELKNLGIEEKNQGN